MIIPFLLFLIGLAALLKGADMLVDGASSIARRLSLSELLIGLTVVAFGTSAPELFVNLSATLKGSAGIAIGNVLGSCIANILLILGISALISPLHVSRGTVWREIPFSLAAALALGILANDKLIDGWAYLDVSRSEGLVFLLLFAVFIYYSAAEALSGRKTADQASSLASGLYREVLFIVLGLAGLAVGGKLIVDGSLHAAEAAGISEALAGLTIVAVGTSLPELAAAAAAAWKGSPEIAVGTVVGSNIFNILFVLGISSVIRPIPFSTAGNIDISVLILASLILFTAMFTGGRRRLDRWEGAFLLLFYAFYIGCLLVRG